MRPLASLCAMARSPEISLLVRTPMLSEFILAALAALRGLINEKEV
jgi:hypothetical protein